MREYTKDELERFEKWVELSIVCSGNGWQHLLMHIQDIGRIDIDLIRKDKQIVEGLKFIKNGEKKEEWVDHSILLTETQALSRLWILGAYEALRIIKERNKENKEISIVYEMFRRIRIPLAKLEAASKYEDDQNFAQLILHPEKGIGWTTHDEFKFSRCELSDKFLTISNFLKNKV